MFLFRYWLDDHCIWHTTTADLDDCCHYSRSGRVFVGEDPRRLYAEEELGTLDPLLREQYNKEIENDLTPKRGKGIWAAIKQNIFG